MQNLSHDCLSTNFVLKVIDFSNLVRKPRTILTDMCLLQVKYPHKNGLQSFHLKFYILLQDIKYSVNNVNIKTPFICRSLKRDITYSVF